MNTATIGLPSGATILAHVAATPRERRAGLTWWRIPLVQGRGMLLAWDQPGRREVTMAGVRFPIDILWLGPDRKILWTVQNAPSELGAYNGYTGGFTGRAAQFVLELRAGEVERLGLKVGDTLQF